MALDGDLNAVDISGARDEVDFASITEILTVSSGIRAQQRILAEAASRISPEFDGYHCIECDDEINPERLKAVVTDHCINCATKKAAYSKQYKRH